MTSWGSAILAIMPAVAPWLAAVFGIAAAAIAERAFHASGEASPPDLWPGANSPFEDFDHSKEIAEHSARDAARAKAAGLQSIATFFGAGAAVEATGASQSGLGATALVLGGVAIALVPSAMRWMRVKGDVHTSNAWYQGLRRTLSERYGRSVQTDVPAAARAFKWSFWKRTKSRRVD